MKSFDEWLLMKFMNQGFTETHSKHLITVVFGNPESSSYKAWQHGWEEEVPGTLTPHRTKSLRYLNKSVSTEVTQ